MKWLRGISGLSVLILLLSPCSAMATSIVQSPVLISEIQTGSKTSASEEFIELVNVSDYPVDLSNWRLDYFSASHTPLVTPSRTIALHGSLAAGEYYLVSSTNYLTDITSNHYSATLAKTGGHLRLVSLDSTKAVTVHDTVGWGTAASPETAAVVVAPEGNSLVRLLNDLGQLEDTDNNQQDFQISAAPTPGAANDYQAVSAENSDNNLANITTPVPTPISQSDNESNESSVSEQTAITLPLQISEVLPNPDGTDSGAEYIELYNPTEQVADLTGYSLQSGNTTYTFKSGNIEPHSYQVFYNSQTKLKLPNSGGQVHLLSPDGSVIDATVKYTQAKNGQAWANINGIWQWTITPTPAAGNILNVAVLSKHFSNHKLTTKSASKISSPAKKSAAKKPSKKSAKSSAKKSTKPAQPATDTVSNASQTAKEIAPVHPSILAGVGGLALLYAAYEYRNDLANFYHKLRANRTTRHSSRAKA